MMTFRKFIRTAHLLLGLSSGLLVFMIAVTGSIYAFQDEIQNITQPYRFVEPATAPVLPPSRIKAIAEQALPGKLFHAAYYQGDGHAAKGIFYSDADSYYYFVYINPYTGKVLKISDENNTFFRFILDGHYYLWLPHDIGHFVVASATLVFLFMVISGIVLWWPRNKNAVRQRFSIKWKSGWRRKNYDLHQVLGFYISWLGLIFALTGLVWGFEWFHKLYYGAVSGGKAVVEYSNPASVFKSAGSSDTLAIDKVWYRMLREYPQAGSIEIHPPVDSLSSIAANANPDPSTYWKTDYRYFDQYTLQEYAVNHNWGRLHQASRAQKLMRMNYDIHVGAVLGLPGKILAFFAGLLIASLPVTGFLLWWGRRHKKVSYRFSPAGAFANPQ